MIKQCTLSVAALLLFSTFIAAARAEATLDKIRKAHALTCGIDQNEAEYSTTDDHGSRVDFDRDLCKAVAVAVLGSDAKVIVKGYPDDETSIAALRSGEIDLVASLSDDFSHAMEDSVRLTRPVLYDGVALMAPIASGNARPEDLSGKKICFLAETETEVALRAWFESRQLLFVPFPFQEQGEMEAAFITGNCAALAADSTRLAVSRVEFGARAKEFALLPGLISKDPLAMAYRSSDTQWGKILDWTINSLIQAEESGVTSANVDALRSSRDPLIERLLGKTHQYGGPLGLSPDWAAIVIKSVGNYGEIFARDLGSSSPLNIPRGANELWTHGGLMYALPLK